ncbi:MAG: bifunctional salicylyl-CoA 5-hydroxylase/oxidoreductase, partial [Gammaproteobacteria bacterium]|nr:bifunctional salicylyl-CoA 5-hydroxylase/oxidoreductase [Gammaproteobacteria bacterium]
MPSATARRPLKIAVVGGGPGGLYFAILMKRANPAHAITVFERNRPDDTFGFGVVFSDETLGNFKERDPESYAAITSEFAYWGDIEIRVRGERLRSGGHGFCGMERKRLLLLLQERARGLGVALVFQHEITDLAALQGHDVIVAADGINSQIRERHAEHFRPHIDWRRNRFCWLGSTLSLPAFTFCFKENEHGVWILGAYQYRAGHSTWVPECDEATWRRAGLDRATETESVAYLERLFADVLNGHRLLTNRSLWRSFPMIRNERWHFRNIVLIGDALHTAHYSIGSGTKLAMEDAIALVDALVATDTVPDALERFETVRKEEVEKTQHAADVSLVWFETPRRFWQLEPMQLAFSLLTRSKQITYENLQRRDGAYVEAVDRWWADKVAREQGLEVPGDPPPPPMFTPFRLREMTLANRVVVSPMGMYSAEDGTPSRFHLVHLGSFALGGAGLVYVETTHVSRESRITPGCCGLYKPEHVAAWREITDFVHASSDARICLQLGHAGRKGSTRRGWEGMDQPLPEANWPLWSASPIPFRPDSQTPKEIDRAEMARVREQFVSAARMAEDAGFDMIELHMAHGYLLSSFISPLTNRRKDPYGGELDHRMRYPLEILDAVRAAWPSKPLAVRISATDWVEDGGLTGEDSVEVARMLKAHGCDLVDVSAGQTTVMAQPVYGRMFQTPFSDAIRNDVGIPTIAVGNITTADQVNTIVASGRADLVALARAHLVNPHFTLQAAAYYGHVPQRWPEQYGPAKEMA